MPIGTGNEPLVKGVQIHWPLRVGDRVTYHEYVDEAPRMLAVEEGRPFPAYQDPPIVGTVQAPLSDRRARCQFPGIGVRDIETSMLKRVEA